MTRCMSIPVKVRNECVEMFSRAYGMSLEETTALFDRSGLSGFIEKHWMYFGREEAEACVNSCRNYLIQYAKVDFPQPIGALR